MSKFTDQFDAVVAALDSAPFAAQVAWDSASCHAQNVLGGEACKWETEAFKEYVVGCVDQASYFQESAEAREFFEEFGIFG
jgi:hypothetical protein